MNEQIKKYIDPIKNFWGTLTKKVKIIIFSVLGGVLVLALVLGLILNQPKYTMLYPKLSDSEAAEVMTELKSLGVDCKESGGNIYVPADKENSLRMQMANEGYPKNSNNYDYFTSNVNIMTTDAERKTIEKFQLNLRLEAVIKTIDTIRDANVTITIPDSSTYAWDDNKESATASVAIEMQQGKTLTTAQVAGIKQLVSKSVPNMKADDVAVIDKSTGAELSSKESTNDSQTDLATFKMQIQKQYENDMKTKVLSILRPVFGTDNVNATVTCNIDLDKMIQESTTYTPSKDNKGVVQQEDTQKEQTNSATSSAGGVAGAQSNTDTTSSTSTTSSTTTTYPGITVSGDKIYSKDSASYKYAVSQLKQQVQSNSANVKSLSIGVVVNKSAMTAQEKTDYCNLIANAAGVNAKNISVYSATFYKSTDQTTNGQGIFSTFSPTAMIIAGGVLGLLLIAMFVSIMIAKQKKKKMALMVAGLNQPVPPIPEEIPEEEEETPMEDVSTEDIGENFGTGSKRAPISIDDIQSHRENLDSKEEALKKELKDFSSQNPEIAAQLIRTWLRGDDEHNG